MCHEIKPDTIGFTHVIEHSAYAALEQKLAKAVAALKFYAPRENWEEFRSNGGIFNEVDGDFLEAFQNTENNGPDGGDTARQTLKYLGESELGEG